MCCIAMARTKEEIKFSALGWLPPDSGSHLWDLDVKELTGKNLEASAREEVNELLNTGWILLHIYTLKYKEDGTWRERPMAILGRVK